MKTVIKTGSGEITFIGNNHWIEIDYDSPDYDDETGECKPFFMYKRGKEYLKEYLNIHNKIHGDYPDYLQSYDGVKIDSYFSGQVIRFNKSHDAVQVYRFYS